jgi:DNA modification methylase
MLLHKLTPLTEDKWFYSKTYNTACRLIGYEVSFGRKSCLVWLSDRDVILRVLERQSQGKELNDYSVLITKCFQEAYRVLKPGRWMTVEFSNTQATIWNTIRKAIINAGFIIASVEALNKGRGGKFFSRRSLCDNERKWCYRNNNRGGRRIF